MGITLQVISFLLGFFAYGATGSLALVLGISVITALAGRFTSRIGMPSSWMMMLGGLAALHLTSGDWIGIAFISITMTLVKVDEQGPKWNGIGLWLSSAIALAGIAGEFEHNASAAILNPARVGIGAACQR